MCRLILVVAILTLPVSNAYTFSFMREGFDNWQYNGISHEYDSLDPKSCQKVNYLQGAGPLAGIKLWTKPDLGRAPWAFLFYADAQTCSANGNSPTLVIYCNKPVSNPDGSSDTFQLVDLEPLRELLPRSELLRYRSWEEIMPGTDKWRLFIEDLNLVPGQMALDSVGRWGERLEPVDPELTRVKMWYLPINNFDEAATVLRDDQLMEQALGKELGFDRFSKGLDDAEFVVRQPTTDKWASIFGIKDIDPNGANGPEEAADVPRQSAIDKWASIFGIPDIDPLDLESVGDDDVEFLDRLNRMPGKLEDDISSLDESLKREYGSDDSDAYSGVPVEIKIENSGFDDSSDSQEAPSEFDDETEKVEVDSNPVEILKKEEPKSAKKEELVERVYGPAQSTKKEELVERVDSPAQSMEEALAESIEEPIEKIEINSQIADEDRIPILKKEEAKNEMELEEPIEKIEITSQSADGNRIPTFKKEEAKNEVELEINPQHESEEEDQSVTSGYYNLPSGFDLTRASIGFAPIPLEVLPSFMNVDRKHLIGISDNLQRQYAIAGKGVEELGHERWNWRNADETKRIAEELKTSLDSRLAARRQRKELSRRLQVPSPRSRILAGYVTDDLES
ncbi:hypothetical protein TWF281_011650 [Arthrobotrys megalospora]